MSRSHSQVSIVIPRSTCHYLISVKLLGSGITVHNLIWLGINASFSIDGNLSQSYYTHDPCYDDLCLNVSISNIQSLAYGNHLLDIAIFSYGIYGSLFEFDYAVVNDTNPSKGASIAPSPTGTRAPSSQCVFTSSIHSR